MIKNNIQLIVSSTGQELEYTNPDNLGIKLNRIANDLKNPASRWGEFSYTITLPFTIKNNFILNFINTNKVRRFNNSSIDIKLYNNNTLLLDGLLDVNEITNDGYKCVFYSKLTGLFDTLKDKNIRDLEGMPQISGFNYETYIRNHINANYKNADEAWFQFPYIYYGTPHTPWGIVTGQNDAFGIAYRDDGDRPQQNYYMLVNTTTLGNNRFYFHQFPMCFYIVKIVEQIFNNAGFSVSGSWLNDENIKKIIMTYAGDNDVYDNAVYCSNGVTPSAGVCSGGGTLMLNTAKMLPKYSQDKFIKDILNMFNLYMIVDPQKKQSYLNLMTYCLQTKQILMIFQIK